MHVASPGRTDTALRDLRRRISGHVVEPGDARYDEARRVWNGMIDRHPAAIVHCVAAEDVQRTVELARAHALPLAVRGGGHNVAGNAVCDGGVVVDLRGMKTLDVDPRARVARAAGGLTLGELDRGTQAHALATTGGNVSTTGIAGFTLGGGLGWLMPKHGLACDNLTGVEIVTADGAVLEASADENADLFWAVRGGGGNFGVVTRFDYRLHPLDGVVGGMLVFAVGDARDVLRRHRDHMRAAPDELAASAAFVAMPDGTPALAIIACWTGADPERGLAPLRAYGAPVADMLQPMAYTDLQTMLDAGTPAGRQNYWKSASLPDLDDAAIDTLVAHAAEATTPFALVLLEHVHGAVTRVPATATAFPHREPHYALGIFAMWEGTEPEPHLRWVRRFADAMHRFSTGTVYVNYLGEEGDARVRAAYGPNFERLVAVKTRYDPGNLFRLNQNIRPRSE
jgi:FAD/FMN-containing dehydrogenase